MSRWRAGRARGRARARQADARDRDRHRRGRQPAADRRAQRRGALVRPRRAGRRARASSTNVSFHTGDSHELLPALLAELAEPGPQRRLRARRRRPLGRAASVATSRTCSPRRPIGRTLILVHDTANEEVRAGDRRASASTRREGRCTPTSTRSPAACSAVPRIAQRALGRPRRRSSSTPGAYAAAPARPRWPISAIIADRAASCARRRRCAPGSARARALAALGARDRAGSAEAVSARPTIALVSRELAPFGGGGIGTYVAATARVLAPVAEVTIFTTDRHRRPTSELAAPAMPASPGCGSGSSPSRAAGRSRTTTAAACTCGARARSRRLRGHTPTAARTWSSSPTSSARGSSPPRPRARSTRACARTTRLRARCTRRREITDVLNGHLPDATSSPGVTLRARALRAAPLRPRALARRRRARHLRALARRRPSPSPVRIRHPLTRRAAPPQADRRRAQRRAALRLLYVGRLERRKGVLDLARAVTGIDADGPAPDDRRAATPRPRRWASRCGRCSS